MVVASMETGGIPFAVQHKTDGDFAVREAVNYRKSGGEFLSADQSLANMRMAIKAGIEYEL